MTQKHLDASIEIETDTTGPIRTIQPEEVRRRSAAMERVRHVYAKTRRDKLLRDAFDELLEDLAERRNGGMNHGPSNRGEGNQLVVLGESGAGKTTAIRRLLDNHALANGYPRNAPGCKIVTVTAPSPCNLAELGRETSHSLGYTIVRNRIDGPEVWRIVRERVRALEILVIHFDEMQHVVQTVNEIEMQKIRNVLKGLLVDERYPIGLIISGTPLTVRLVHPDRQVARRGRWIELPPLSIGADSKMVGSFITQLAKEAELEFDESEQHQVVPRLLHAGTYQLGVVAEEIHNAIRVALRSSAAGLTLKHFGDAFANRTGNLAPWNPYFASNWVDLDATRVLVTSETAYCSDANTSSLNGTRGKSGGKK
ncbi:TniB family NTP-binding protein [Microvirga yunnanensis]|uniref:TniB family NTP-binding protein n=1 Tax=Microvirga yunnanensis TaxID=2953740 RepID=UPI0021C9A8E8|nr:TniB family NTP-binding protein [Microvirga sp. HBU65207]